MVALELLEHLAQQVQLNLNTVIKPLDMVQAMEPAFQVE